MTDTIQIVSTSLMGLSVACAQCHDHRYDPIPQTDYYALRAIFEPALDYQQWQTPVQRQISLYTEAERQRAEEVDVEVKKLETEKKAKEQELINQALTKELRKREESLREPLRMVYKTPQGERTNEQNSLLKMHPSIKDINPGTLYLYLSLEDLKQYDTRIAETPSRNPTIPPW